MNRWLRVGGWTVLGLALLWIIFEVVSIILSFVSWVISITVSLLVVAILLFLAYLGVSRLIDRGNGSTTQPRERERSFN